MQVGSQSSLPSRAGLTGYLHSDGDAIRTDEG